MRKTTLCLVLALTTVAIAQNPPQWPQPIIKGKMVIWGGDKAKSEARTTFVAIAGADTEIVVIVKDPAAAKKDWESATSASIVSTILPQDLARSTALWLEVLPTTEAETNAVLGVKQRGGVVALSNTLMDSGDFSGLLPYFGPSPSTDDNAHALAIADLVLSIDAGAILLTDGRVLFCRGEGEAKIAIHGKSEDDTETVVLSGRTRADLVSLRRRAIEKSLPSFPTKVASVTDVKSGTLFIVGGGGMPTGMLEQFIEAAGGPDAPIVYVPCEFLEQINAEPGFVRALKQAGAKNVSWIHTKDRVKADTDEEFLKPLKDAGGVWYGGGRQWNLVDSYMDTRAHELMRAVLERGGAIGGSSAGASIQAEFLARGDPLGNLAIIEPGYMRGLGFLPGVAVDQHFTQRSRHKDMTQLMETFPQLLGIGIDESTAIIVTRTTAEVAGRGQVFFYDYRAKPTGDTDYTALKAGEKYDLAKRKKIED